jgi:uncharacterized phage protein gp47/JayE
VPIKVKSFADFVNLMVGKAYKALPGIDPTIKASIINSSIVSNAAGMVSCQEGIKDAVNQSFPQTADDEFLELHGDINKVVRFPAQEAIGQGAATGVLGTAIDINSPITFNGNSYINTNSAVVQEYTGGLSLSFSGGLVTAVTNIDHTLSTGLQVAISNAVQTEYNGTFDIVVLSDDTFTYELTAGALNVDTGNYSSEYALLQIESVLTGLNKNAAAGSVMTINETGLDGFVYVGFGGLVLGRDIEDFEAYRVRVMDSNSLTPGIATPPMEVFSAKSITGNTRVFIVRPNGTSSGTPGEPGYLPQIGETVIYIVRDDDPSIIPSTSILDATKAQLIADGVWPSFIPDDHLYVIAPLLKTQDFHFTSITPNTITMQNAINNQLPAFFEDNTTVEGGTILLTTLNKFLDQVQDPDTGKLLTDYVYTTPASDIVQLPGELYTRGNVTFG